jgi:hypothetical protein
MIERGKLQRLAISSLSSATGQSVDAKKGASMLRKVRADSIRPGDWISSECFEFAYNDGTSEIVHVGLREKLLLPNCFVEVEEGGKIAVYPVRDDHFDRSNAMRPSYKYVVLSVSEQWRNIDWSDTFPEIDCCGPGEGIRIDAQILDNEDDYNPTGERIQFWMKGNFPDVIEKVDLLKRVELEPFLEKGRKKYEEEQFWKSYKSLI